MTWPWQRLRLSDEIIACACGSIVPALPQAPLANMVRRGSAIVRVNTGSMLQCIACGQKYFVATQGPHKGLIKLQREPTPALLPDIRPDADEVAKRLKRAVPIAIRDEMRDPP